MTIEITEEQIQEMKEKLDLKISLYMLHEDTVHLSIHNDDIFNFLNDYMLDGIDTVKVTKDTEEGFLILEFQQGWSIIVTDIHGTNSNGGDQTQ